MRGMWLGKMVKGGRATIKRWDLEDSSGVSKMDIRGL